MADDKIAVIGAAWAGIEVQQRTRASGSTRATLTVQVDCLAINLDENGPLGQKPAEALAATISEAIKSPTNKQADPGTILNRYYAYGAMTSGGVAPKKKAKVIRRGTKIRGDKWTKDNYAGGRLGVMLPGQGSFHQYGYDSGRLAKSIVARLVGKTGEYILNVASNRLRPDFVQRRPDFVAWLQQIVAGVLTSRKLDEAIAQGLGASVQEIQNARKEAVTKVMNEMRNLANAARGLGNEFEELSEAPEEG